MANENDLKSNQSGTSSEVGLTNPLQEVNNPIKETIKQTSSTSKKTKTSSAKNSSAAGNNQSDVGKVLSNFVQIASKFFKDVSNYFNKKTTSDKKIEKILEDIKEILGQDISGGLTTVHKTLLQNGNNLSDEKMYYQQMNMFLKTLPAGIVTTLNTKIANIESALNKLLAESQKETTVTPEGSAPEISDQYLESYKTVMEQFNEALSITADELLNFKTKIVYQQGDIINGQNNTMLELFSDVNLSFNDKLDTIINSLNNLVETQQSLNPLNQDEIISSVNTLIDNISITNNYLDNLLNVNNETNELIKSNNLNDTQKDIIDVSSTAEEPENSNLSQPVVIPPPAVYYNVPDDISDREFIAETIDYIAETLTVNGEEPPVESDDFIDEQIDELIGEVIKTNDNIINTIFEVRSDTLLSDFKESFDNFSEKNNNLLTAISEQLTELNVQSSETSLSETLYTELSKELKSLNSQLVTINTDGIFIKPDSVIEAEISDSSVEQQTDLNEEQETESEILNDINKPTDFSLTDLNFGNLSGGIYTNYPTSRIWQRFNTTAYWINY